METPKDTFKVQLVSCENKINQTTSRIIVINQKEKELKEKEFFETTLFISFLYPLFITLIVFLITHFITRRKDKAERELINEKINQIRRDFQPYILATLQKTQETILEDKIKTLREIVKFKTDFYNVPNAYFDGIGVIDDINYYYKCVYLGFINIEYKNIRDIVLLNGYLFPENIKEKLNNILEDLVTILDIQNRESSLIKSDIPMDALEILKKLSTKFNIVIDEIRKDLHLDDRFIHDFIKKYKATN